MHALLLSLIVLSPQTVQSHDDMLASRRWDEHSLHTCRVLGMLQPNYLNGTHMMSLCSEGESTAALDYHPFKNMAAS